jgi:glycerophosphoryl diester phosphodiesterase
VYAFRKIAGTPRLQLSSILAHRGWFLEPSEKNSAIALERALQNGFGIETDVRDLNRRLIISHDPPQDSSELLDLEWLFSLIQSTGSKGRVALNIKADGLIHLISPLLQSTCIKADQVFAFDMSIPDTIGYLEGIIPAYSRISEYEESPCFIDQARGVWVDNFTGTGSQTVFTLSASSLGENYTFVYINGVYQNKNTYTVAATALTFSTAPPLTSLIEVMYN